MEQRYGDEGSELQACVTKKKKNPKANLLSQAIKYTVVVKEGSLS